MQTSRFRFKGFRAGWAFALLAVVFILCFGIMVGLIWADQGRIIETTRRLQDKTVPEIIRYQRLARDLEQLRQEGERVFSASTPQARQQSMFIVTLVASHPSVLEHREAAERTREVERFLVGVVHAAASNEAAFAANFDEWQRLSARLGLLVDDLSIQGVNLTRNDLGDVAAAIQRARFKLNVVMIVVGLFLLLFLVLLRAHLIQPLQRIDKALSGLGVDQPAPRFKPAALAEIQTVGEAIGKLHKLLAENEKARQALEALANRDGLTGLYNRRHFMVAAEAELHRAQRYRRPVIVGMADLDRFKRLNDTYGHAAGDTVLRTFAALLQETLRQSDLVCRYGGEEFAFLFPEITLADAVVLAERCRAACADNDISLADGRSIRVTFSMGLADASESTLEAALNRADEALYEAKRRGRNRVLISGQLPLIEGLEQISNDTNNQP
ncbi:GGDEF domain-containing protein [Azonexus sp.]|jgi:diguanylate cyclase (GGDEF)-like protein|uniref:GGDEF domain-containing protein n=1 Tax=Azonexus sp. TaxID=1872668 RepID=UPI002818F3A8|nr:GGDEF domain-containing protein [Azonexus sp.]MDR1994880.1 GGDEF domain-containing protein [Azonexus sp.]